MGMSSTDLLYMLQTRPELDYYPKNKIQEKLVIYYKKVVLNYKKLMT